MDSLFSVAFAVRAAAAAEAPLEAGPDIDELNMPTDYPESPDDDDDDDDGRGAPA